MKYKYIILIIVLLLSFLSCTEKKEIISENDINKLIDGNYLIPSKNGTLNLYVLSDKEEIIITNTDYLNYVYENYYKKKYSNYKKFLSDALNQKNKININYFRRIPYKKFRINKIIESEYKQLSFADFFKLYTKGNISDKDSFTLRIKENASLDEIRTISYYFYLNGYQVIVDDYFPKYLVFKRDKILK